MASGSQNMTTYKAKQLVNTYGGEYTPVWVDNGILKAITAGTTGQFYRGDNSWSNTLANDLYLSGAKALYINSTGAIAHNGTNLWIGATATNSNVFSGNLYLNGGLDDNGKRNRAVYVSLGANANATTGTNYAIVHKDATGSSTNGIYVDSNGKTIAMSYSLSATVNAASVKNTFAYYSGTNAISSYPRIRNIGSARYPIDLYVYNDAGNLISEIWYDAGDATNVTKGQWNFLSESPNSTNNTGTTGKYEYFYLPNVDTGRTSNASYAIRTSKSSAYNVDTATHLSSAPNNTTTFYRGDQTWTNTISNEFKIVRTTTDWKTGATLTFNTTMGSTTGYSYIASYQTPTATTYNDSLVIVATGGCFIGGGEGAETIHQNVMSGSGTEDLYLCPDGSIQIYTGADNKTKRATIDSTPSFYPATTETGNIGTSSYKWSNMYAVHFNGFATDVGDGSSMWIHPQSSDEINFGGTGGTKIYFGHRDIGSRAKPTDYYFGGTAASATVRATTFVGALSGNASTASALAAYASIGSSTTDHGVALKNWFTANKSTAPRNQVISFYSATSGNGSQYMGYFLSGYADNPYGGFFVCHYNNPYYVGIQNGTYTQQHILTSTNYSSYAVTLSTDQTITGTKTFQKRIIAYAYKQSSALPFITFDKPGSYATGIGPDGTSNRIHFGPCPLDGTSWTAQSSFNSNQWHFQGSIYGTSTLTIESSATISGGIISNHGHNMMVGGNEVNFIPDSYNDTFWFNYETFNRKNNGTISQYLMGDGHHNWNTTHIYAGAVHNAVWNDFAEFRESDITEPGRTLVSNGYGQMILCQERLAAGAKVISDTYGCSVGESDQAKTPLGVAGRVLAYPYQDRNNYKPGDAVCAAPHGTIDIMTREEIMMYPDRIIGIVDEVPTYERWEQWHTCYKEETKDSEFSRNKVADIQVNGRIWIYVR